MSKRIFVFGSNTGGIHGRGAALVAYQRHGAIMGEGVGHHGNSYAIPTKGHFLKNGRVRVGNTLELDIIRKFVNDFLVYASKNQNMQFDVTRVGCGLAGLHDTDIAPMFINSPTNCLFDNAWEPIFNSIACDLNFKYWGTF